jgi:threonylcarbamoyladenosine tRNA methylthiotransferase MtaB
LKYIIVTLGCKVNQYETQAVETILREHGHEPCPGGETADAVIVNTCAVTAESGRKSRQAVRALMEANPGAVTAVCGCYSQLSPDTAEKLGADVVYGSGDRDEAGGGHRKCRKERHQDCKCGCSV